jgi:putative redox protein
MKSTKLSFHNDDGIELAAKLDMPDDGTATLYALFAHCFTCAKNLTAVRRISRGLTAAGIGVLSFDFTGLGESEGEFAQTGFSSQTADLVSAAAFLRDQVDTGPAILVGHSLGGTAALYAAREIDGVRGLPRSALRLTRAT